MAVPSAQTLGVMHASPFFLERLVAHHLAALPPAEVGRNEHGISWFKWSSPCPQIEALWLYVGPREVTLSTKHFHQHFDLLAHHHPRRCASKRQRKLAAARQAVREAAAFMRGERVVVLDADSPGQASCCRLSQLSETIARWKKLATAQVNLQAWAWSGALPR